MSSVRLVIVTESTADVFLTVTEKDALPPGSGSDVGSAVFVTRIELRRVRDPDGRVVLVGDVVAVVVLARRRHHVRVAAAGVAADRTRERAAIGGAGRDRLRHVAGALAVQVAVDVVRQARDRDRVDAPTCS